MEMTASIYPVQCPYCPRSGLKATITTHMRKDHPDKPMPSDKGFPGWPDER